MNDRLHTYLGDKRFVLTFLLTTAILFLLPVIAEAQPELCGNQPCDKPSERGGFLTTIGDGLANILYQMVVAVFGTIAGWMGKLFNYAIYMYTINFGVIYLNTGLGVAIDTLWSLIRDVFNLTFIFGLVYIGIRLILDSEDSNAKRALVMLIGAALLVNFSLFFTKVVIDTSHVLTDAIANGFGDLESENADIGRGTIAIKDVSGVFVNLMDLSSIYNADGDDVVKVDSGGRWGLIFLTMIILLIAAFVFAAGALLLIVRFIALNFYLVLSPVMFLGWVFPNLASFSRQWWAGFLRSAFIAPAFLFMIYLSARTLESFKLVTLNSKGISKAVTGGGEVGLYSIIPYFIIIAGFLIGSVIVAQKMGVAGSNTVIKVGGDLRGRAQRAMTYGPRVLGRNVTNATSKGIEQGFDRMQRKSRTYNALTRNKVSRFLGVDTAADSIVRGTAQAGRKATFGTGRTREQTQQQAKKIESRYTTQQAVDAGMAELEKKPEERNEAAIAKMQSTIASMGAKQFEELSQQEREQYVEFMKQDQFDKLMDSESLNEGEKNQLREARKTAVGNMIRENGEVIAKELNKLSVTQLETLGDEFIREYAHLFSKSQMDDIKKSKNFTEGQKGAFIGAREGKIKESVKSGADGAREIFMQRTKEADKPEDSDIPYKERKPSEIAELPREALLSKNALPYMNAATLEQIADKKSLGFEDRETLRDNIMASPDPQLKEAQKYLKSTRGQRDWNTSSSGGEQPPAGEGGQSGPSGHQPFSPKGNTDRNRPQR